VELLQVHYSGVAGGSLLWSCWRFLALEEQDVYSPKLLSRSRSVGAECTKAHGAPLERTIVQRCAAINMVLLWSTCHRLSMEFTFGQSPVKRWEQ